MKQKILLGVAVAVLVLLAVVIFTGRPLSDNGQDGTDDESADIKPQDEARYITEEPREIAAGFPPGFPLELDQVKVSQEYIPQNSTNSLLTLAYESRKTFTENKTTFKGYLSAEGYEIVNAQESDTELFYYATKGMAVITVSVSDREGAVHVSVSYAPDLSN